jgi:predicted nucleic acid-binding Zn ribbon protein
LELFSLEEKVAFCRAAFSFVAVFLISKVSAHRLHAAFQELKTPSGRIMSQRQLTVVLEGPMFCDGCGAALQADQTFCSRCGKQLMRAPFGYPRRDRVQEHVRLLGIFWLAISALNVLGGAVLMILANTLFVHLAEQGAPKFLQPLLSFVAIFILVKAFAGFLGGWGLLQHEPWARILTLILAFLALFNIPFGTALGVYTLWVLLPAESEEQYEALTRAA